MIRRSVIGFGIFVLCWCAIFVTPARGASMILKLSNGETVEGEPVSFNAQGVVVKKADGTFAPRVAWPTLSQPTLKELSLIKGAKPFVEGLLEPEDVDPTGKAGKPEVEFKVKIPNRLDRPDPQAGLGALPGSPVTMLFLILIYVGNIYAGYEAGVFRNYSWVLTCGVAAVLPIIGPIIFIALPTRIQKSQDQIAAESMAAHLAAQQGQEVEEAAVQEPTPEELAAQKAAADAAAAAAAGPLVVTFARGQTTFNRRFFETKFAGFLRVVPGEAEKDKVLYIKSARGEHMGARLSRIDPNELYLQVKEGVATTDVMIPFLEIYEVQIRPVGV
ncbi:MAG: hypothetical protein QOF48_445 [Verrucomicrobiota bacterium]|jgi:hypothetical protein